MSVRAAFNECSEKVGRGVLESNLTENREKSRI